MFACIWIYIGILDDEWMDDIERQLDGKAETYVNAIYFVTTTMTSVGYGDFNAWDGEHYK